MSGFLFHLQTEIERDRRKGQEINPHSKSMDHQGLEERGKDKPS